MTLNIVQLYDDPTLLTDIPGQLRTLADRIETGDLDATAVLCVIPIEGDWPMLFGWGEDLGEYGRIGVLQTMVSWLTGRQVAR